MMLHRIIMDYSANEIVDILLVLDEA